MFDLSCFAAHKEIPVSGITLSLASSLKSSDAYVVGHTIKGDIRFNVKV